jgi:general secretion pathway protein E
MATADMTEKFAAHLKANNAISRDLVLKSDSAEIGSAARSLYKLWEATELPGNDFADEVAKFWGLPRISLPELIAANSATGAFSRRFLLETRIFPYRASDGRYRLAAGDPTDAASVRAAEIVLGQAIEVDIASFEDIGTVLAERLGQQEENSAADQTSVELAHAAEDVESLRDLASGAPVVRAVNDLMERAVELRATDIHIEPFRTGLVIRMRVDGLLRVIPTPAGVLPQAVVSRIKILAGLNIAERRLPQDGAARLHIGKGDLDIRVATMPTQHGESAVLRLLSKTGSGAVDLSKLGLSPADHARVSQFLNLPHGMIVVTGPTGSGKTTTLATMLTLLNDTSRKILTVEDPVEYEIPGVNQSQVKPGIGLTFAAAMRAFVRQDPDVIMVGEVRDPETAHIAVHAALTGHLLLTTLHTETAAAAVPRLLDLGLEGFLLQSTLRGVIAQRLLRLLCDRCKTSRAVTATDLSSDPRYAMLGFRAGEEVHEPAGCERCGGTGFRGRCGAFEIIEVTDDIRKLIGPHTDSREIERAAVAAGMTTMNTDATAKCRAGITSVAEVLRVTTVR